MSVIVFGSAIADLLFNLPRLPAAGETVLGQAGVTQPGGKGANQARAAARAGASVAFAGAVGDDSNATLLRAALEADGVDCRWLWHEDAPTGLACVMVDRAGDNQIAVSPGANARARQATIPDADLAGATLLLQMEVPAAENAALMTRARARGARSILNLAPAAPLPGTPDILVVNEPEAAFLAAMLGCDARAGGLQAALGCTVLRTLGAAGAESAAGQVAGFAVGVVDTVGAGDAWCGALAAALVDGAPLEMAMRFANAAGALACTRRGAWAPGRDAVESMLRS